MMGKLTRMLPPWIKRLTPIYGALLLTACGDPAPGEGIDFPKAMEPAPQIVSASEALNSANIPEVDLGTMDEAEIAKVIPPGPYCSFAYLKASPPVLAAAISGNGTAVGVIKIHGRLVKVTAQEVRVEELADGAVFVTKGVRLEVTPDLNQDSTLDDGKRRWPADLIFELEQGLHVGYHGWYSCGDAGA